VQFELLQSFNDKSIATCPRCGKLAHRLFSPVPVIFKGPGFYITDSRAEREASFDGKRLRQREKEMDKGGERP
jgi:putative FmdB family regulatory protein